MSLHDHSSQKTPSSELGRLKQAGELYAADRLPAPRVFVPLEFEIESDRRTVTDVPRERFTTSGFRCPTAPDRTPTCRPFRSPPLRSAGIHSTLDALSRCA